MNWKGLLPLFLLFASFSYGQSTENDYDFDVDQYKFNSPEDLARSYFQLLVTNDTARILEHCISKEVMGYMIGVIAPEKRDMVPTMLAQYDQSSSQYVIGTKNLIWKVEKEEIDLSHATIERIDGDVEDWQKLAPLIVFSDVKVTISSGEETHVIRLAQCGRLKGKWFILGPDFKLNDRTMMYDRPQWEFENLLEENIMKVIQDKD